MHRLEREKFSKRTFQFKIELFVLTENLAKQLILVAQSILKLDNFGRKTLKRYIITYIRVGVALLRFSHKTQPREVAFLALDLLSPL
jgi:hypothetical protein